MFGKHCKAVRGYNAYQQHNYEHGQQRPEKEKFLCLNQPRQSRQFLLVALHHYITAKAGKTMRKYIFAYPVLFFSIVFLGILSQGAATAISFFMMFVVDSIATGDMSNLVTSAIIGAGIVLMFFLLLWTYTKIMVYYSYKTTLKLKTDLFSSILGTKISDFSQSNSAKHISIINNDIQMVSDKYIGGILETTKFITNIILSLTAMAFLSPANALIALVLSSSPLILPIIFGKRLAETNMDYMQKLASLNEKVKDYLMGFEVIKSFGIEKNINEKFSASAQEAEKGRYKAGKVSVKLGSLSGTFMIATEILTYLVAGYFVITGHITIGAVIAIAGLNHGIIGPMQYLSLNLANIKSTREIRERLLQALSPLDLQVRNKAFDFFAGIKAENLSFKYEALEEKKPPKKKSKPTIRMIPTNGKSVEEILAELGLDPKEGTIIDASSLAPNILNSILDSPETITDTLPVENAVMMQGDGVLKNISFTFKPGGKYAIVGGSGSGKSTLLKILMGYYDNYLGSVSINGNEICDINRENLYRSFSMMHQNVFMLDDTLRNNITLLNPYSEEKYAQAVEKAKLNDLIQSLPNGSLTNVGEGGNTLSGGERQRVAIARALIKGSEVIMLDEAMANLDNETAYAIEKNLLDTPNITCIFITHRYSKELLRLCDGILVLRGGELVECGTFDELYEKKDYFYSLYNIGAR